MSDPIDPNLYSWLTRVGAVSEEEPARSRPVLPSQDERAAFYESLVSQGLEGAVEWLTNRDQMAEMTGNPYYPIRNPAHTGAINYAMQSPLLDTAVEGTSGYMNRLAQGQGDLRAVGGGFSDAARHVMENAGAYLDPNQAVEGRSWADVPGMEMPAWQALAADAGTSMFDLMPGLGRGMFSAAGAADPRQITGPVDAPTMRRWAEDLLSLHNEATMRRATNATPEAVEGIQTAAGSFRNTLPDVLNMILESADDTTLNYFRNDPAAQVTLTNMEEVLANSLRAIYTEGVGGMQGAAGRARTAADRVQDALIDDFGVDPAVAQEASNEIFRRGFGTGRRVAGSPGQGVRHAAQERGLNPGYGGARFDPLSHGLKQFGDYRMVENLAPDLWQDFVRRGELADVQANVRQADYQQPGGEVRRLPRNYNPETAPMGAQDVSPDAFGPAQTNQPSGKIFGGMSDDEAQQAFDRIAYEGMYRERVGPHLEQPELDYILAYAQDHVADPSANWLDFYNEVSGLYTGQSGAPVDAIERAARRHGVPMNVVYQIPGPDGRPVLDPRRLEQGVPADALGELRARQMFSGDQVIRQGEEQNLWDHRGRVAEGERILEENKLYGPPYTEAAAPEGVELRPGERLMELLPGEQLDADLPISFDEFTSLSAAERRAFLETLPPDHAQRYIDHTITPAPTAHDADTFAIEFDTVADAVRNGDLDNLSPEEAGAWIKRLEDVVRLREEAAGPRGAPAFGSDEPNDLMEEIHADFDEIEEALNRLRSDQPVDTSSRIENEAPQANSLREAENILRDNDYAAGRWQPHVARSLDEAKWHLDRIEAGNTREVDNGMIHRVIDDLDGAISKLSNTALSGNDPEAVEAMAELDRLRTALRGHAGTQHMTSTFEAPSGRWGVRGIDDRAGPMLHGAVPELDANVFPVFLRAIDRSWSEDWAVYGDAVDQFIDWLQANQGFDEQSAISFRDAYDFLTGDEAGLNPEAALGYLTKRWPDYDGGDLP